ncbi:MAG: protein-export chaperone SecB [bacterium]
MEAITSMLKFQNYHIEEIKFITYNDCIYPKKGSPINIDFKCKIASFEKKEDTSTVVVALEIDLFKGYEKPPLSLNLVVSGVFESNVENKEEFAKTWLSNCTAILFPYIRETVSYITKNSNFPHLLLPTINIVETLKQQQKK